MGLFTGSSMNWQVIIIHEGSKNIVCFFKRVDLTLHFLTIVLIKT